MVAVEIPAGGRAMGDKGRAGLEKENFLTAAKKYFRFGRERWVDPGRGYLEDFGQLLVVERQAGRRPVVVETNKEFPAVRVGKSDQGLGDLGGDLLQREGFGRFGALVEAGFALEELAFRAASKALWKCIHQLCPGNCPHHLKILANLAEVGLRPKKRGVLHLESPVPFFR